MAHYVAVLPAAVVALTHSRAYSVLSCILELLLGEIDVYQAAAYSYINTINSRATAGRDVHVYKAAAYY